jgi:FMN reductase
MRTAVVVGNPKPASRTLDAAVMLAGKIAEDVIPIVVDVVNLGPGLLGWGDDVVTAAIESVRAVDIAIFASPTYKAAYTGLLKIFLDLIPADGLAGVVAVPLMLGAGPAHALAPELLLEPVLVELGATCPTKALYLMDSRYDDGVGMDDWLRTARRQLRGAVNAVVS